MRATFRRSLARGLARTAVTGALVVGATAVVLPSAPVSASVFENAKRWPIGVDGYAIIPVCVTADSSATQSSGRGTVDTNPSLDVVVGQVRDALRRSWERHSGVRFVGWQKCDELAGWQQDLAIHLKIHPLANNNSRVGTDSKGNSANPTQFKPWGNTGVNLCIDERGVNVWGYRFDCAEQYGIHEFGHAIGFLHEWQHPDKPPECTAAQNEGPVARNQVSPTFDTDFAYTVVNPHGTAAFDKDSIMTYETNGVTNGCALVTGVRFGSPELSAWDQQGARTVYPQVELGANDVGVIPDVAGSCPAPKEVLIHLDNENNDNQNLASGWVGATKSSTTDDTTLEFCRVDGTRFGRLAAPATGRADYAVLRLGESCPTGSTEFVRFHDDNDPSSEHRGNAYPVLESWMAGETGPTIQNAQGTTLHWCLFEQTTGPPGMTAFPNVARVGYGVVAPSDFTAAATVGGSKQTGSVYTDDKDTRTGNSNQNTLKGASDAELPATTKLVVDGLMETGENTRIRLAEVPVDLTAPTITRTGHTPAPNGNNWNRADVTLSWACADADSVPSTWPIEATRSTEGHNQTVTATCTDAAGNAVSDDRVVSIDKTVPTATLEKRTSPNAAGWNNTNVEVTSRCRDELSGVPFAFYVRTITVEGAGHSVTGTCTDFADNVGTNEVTQVNLDRRKPDFTARATTADDNYAAGNWTNQDVTVRFDCTDTLSGVASVSPDVTITADGADQSASGTCTDKADNVATVDFTNIKIDRRPPDLTARATTADGDYIPGTWTNQAVTVTFDCTDTLSGVASVSPEVTITDDGADQAADGTCLDRAGNTAGTTLSDIDLDKTAPDTTATLGGPTGPLGWFTGDVEVSLTATDALSGVAATTYRVDGGPPQAYGSPITITESGSHTVSFTSTDVAGNVETEGVVDVEIARYALFAGLDTCATPRALEWSGSSHTVNGDVHSNGGLRISGSRNRVEGTGSSRCETTISGSGNTMLAGPIEVTAIAAWPSTPDAADLPCTITREGTFDLNRDGPWWVGGRKTSGELVAGVYCATGTAGRISLSGSSITGDVTLVAPRIELSGSHLDLTAHHSGVLALATGDGQPAIKVSGSNDVLRGLLLAQHGRIELSGSGGVVEGGVMGATVRLSGSGWRIDRAG